MSRIAFDHWALKLAAVVSERATCRRRQVGAVLVNKRGHILATGYNGVAAGQHHCNELPSFFVCPGGEAASGTNLDGCFAIHAEQNALLQCRDVHEIVTCYVTVSPCITCTKLLLNTSCQRIVASGQYAGHEDAERLWVSSGRQWDVL